MLWESIGSGRVLFVGGFEWQGDLLGFLMSAPCLQCCWSVTYRSSGTLAAAFGWGGRLCQGLLYSSFCSGLLLHILFYKCVMFIDRVSMEVDGEC